MFWVLWAAPPLTQVHTIIFFFKFSTYTDTISGPFTLPYPYPCQSILPTSRLAPLQHTKTPQYTTKIKINLLIQQEIFTYLHNIIL